MLLIYLFPVFPHLFYLPQPYDGFWFTCINSTIVLPIKRTIMAVRITMMVVHVMSMVTAVLMAVLEALVLTIGLVMLRMFVAITITMV